MCKAAFFLDSGFCVCVSRVVVRAVVNIAADPAIPSKIIPVLFVDGARGTVSPVTVKPV